VYKRQELELSGRAIDKEILEKEVRKFFTNQPAFWDRGYVERKVKEIIEKLIRKSEKLEKEKNQIEIDEGNFAPIIEEPNSINYKPSLDDVFYKLEGLNRGELLNLLRHLIRSHPELLDEVREFLE
jgi:hypothetical protein